MLHTLLKTFTAGIGRPSMRGTIQTVLCTSVVLIKSKVSYITYNNFCVQLGIDNSLQLTNINLPVTQKMGGGVILALQ